jgi:hypothetical protein
VLWSRRPTDAYTLAALTQGVIQVDPQTGAITGRTGQRLERRTRDGGGRVKVQSRPRVVWAPAHRVVWLAVFGPIPAHSFVRHRNGRRWDNRPDNLELTRRRGFVTYPEGSDAGPSGQAR